MKSKAWEAVVAELPAVKKISLRQQFTKDPGRASRFTVEAAGWTLDYSKNLITRETMKKLIALAEEADLKRWIEAMFTGEKINATENRAVLHTALRSFSGEKILVDGSDVMPDIAAVLEKMGLIPVQTP